MPLADVRYALRLWKRHPTLVVVAGLSLGLGVGATTTMYSVVNKVAHYDLGFKDVDRLAVLWSTDTEQGNRPSSRRPGRSCRRCSSTGTRSRRSASSRAAARRSPSRARPRRAGSSQMPVDVNGLSIVGRRAAPRAAPTALEDFDDLVKQKEARSIVVSYETWQRRLGGAPDVIGTSIHVDGEPRTVIGVMPRGFTLVPWADDIAFWAANDLSRIPQGALDDRGRPPEAGCHVAAAQAEATAISRQVLEARGEKPGGAGAEVVPLHEAFFGGARRRPHASCSARSASCC